MISSLLRSFLTLLRRRETAGTVAVEFAFFVSLFLIIVAATIDYGFWIFTASELTAAVSAGSQYAVDNAAMVSSNPSGTRDRHRDRHQQRRQQRRRHRLGDQHGQRQQRRRQNRLLLPDRVARQLDLGDRRHLRQYLHRRQRRRPIRDDHREPKRKRPGAVSSFWLDLQRHNQPRRTGEAGVRRRALGRAQDGAIAVEFAILAPVFLALVFGTIEFGRLMWTYQALQETAIAGARCMALPQTACASAGNPPTYNPANTTTYIQGIASQWGGSLSSAEITKNPYGRLRRHKRLFRGVTLRHFHERRAKAGRHLQQRNTAERGRLLPQQPLAPKMFPRSTPVDRLVVASRFSRKR